MEKRLAVYGQFYNFAAGIAQVTLQLLCAIKLKYYGKKVQESRTAQAGAYQ